MPAKTFKTPKGTELEFLNLKGKDYLPVQARLVWFREEKPDWSITTEFEWITDGAVATAIITDGKTTVTAHKVEHLKHFPDFLEKAETGAIGRALALLGYGTQFAQELDEEERIVDAPVQPRISGNHASTIRAGIKKTQEHERPTGNGGDAGPIGAANNGAAHPARTKVIAAGFYKGKSLTEIDPNVLDAYVATTRQAIKEKGKPAPKEVEETLSMIENYLNKLSEEPLK